MHSSNRADPRSPQAESERHKFYETIGEQNLTPLWEVLHALVPEMPSSPCVPAGWHYRLLPSHFSGRPYRATDSRVFCCLEGEGRIETDAWTFEFAARDVFVVPCWTAYRFTAAAESVLFSFSDRPVQQAFGLWREERPATLGTEASR